MFLSIYELLILSHNSWNNTFITYNILYNLLIIYIIFAICKPDKYLFSCDFRINVQF